MSWKEFVPSQFATTRGTYIMDGSSSKHHPTSTSKPSIHAMVTSEIREETRFRPERMVRLVGRCNVQVQNLRSKSFSTALPTCDVSCRDHVQGHIPTRVMTRNVATRGCRSLGSRTFKWKIWHVAAGSCSSSSVHLCPGRCPTPLMQSMGSTP